MADRRVTLTLGEVGNDVTEAAVGPDGAGNTDVLTIAFSELDFTPLGVQRMKNSESAESNDKAT